MPALLDLNETVCPEVPEIGQTVTDCLFSAFDCHEFIAGVVKLNDCGDREIIQKIRFKGSLDNTRKRHRDKEGVFYETRYCVTTWQPLRDDWVIWFANQHDETDCKSCCALEIKSICSSKILSACGKFRFTIEF